MPTIIGGLRMSMVYTVSWAVLAAMIGLGGLGTFIYQGVQSSNNALILLAPSRRPCWPSSWAGSSICSRSMWCPRDCGRGAVTHDPLHGGGTPVHGGVRHCHRHSHRVPMGLLCYLSRAARGVVLRVVDLIQTTPP